MGIEVVLFAVSGGASSVRQLLYLRKLSNFGRAVDGTLTASNVLIRYKRVAAGFETVSFTSSIVSSQYNYLANTTNDQANREKYETQRNLFGLLTILSGVGAAFTQLMLPKLCNKLADEINNATAAGISYEIEPQIKDVVLSIGDLSVYYPAFRNKLLEFNFPPAEGLIQKLDALSDTKKNDFYFEFANKDQAFFEALHNYDDAIGVNHWRDLNFYKIPERYEIDVLTNTALVQSYKRFYAESTLGDILSTATIIKRKYFIDVFKDIDLPNFTKFVNDPSLIQKWFRYDITELRGELKALLGTNNDDYANLIKFFERYGNVSDEAIALIRNNPKDYIKHLNSFLDATQNIFYFNLRRAEMLPPPFRDIEGSSGLYGTQEIDSFIQLELQIGNQIFLMVLLLA